MILLDIRLPQMDGYAVAREPRKNPMLQNTPILAVTPYALVGDREKALAAGCRSSLAQPGHPDPVVTEIEGCPPPASVRKGVRHEPSFDRR
jgi:CheY-like chemotaxis protein